MDEDPLQESEIPVLYTSKINLAGNAQDEKNPFHQSIGEDLCINNYTAGFDNLHYMGQFSIDGKYG